ncbi:Alpha/Beta hydrolase protein [Immersiella caudata]|uniref:Alpha/Beta hydrolase protein n=1 Tax=Immersiella caudata TaxID=314043 RepID=A0AA40C2R9_9PEZI|nr:Alpha/Beta hydrolase protein [Immersiella caudata]
MLRHGYLRSPICWVKYAEKSFKGIWIVHDPAQKPDVVIYYVHGGGFVMGSSYFYLEFLMTWLLVLIDSGYNNPAIFALEYTLVPDALYPTQIEEGLASYDYVLSIVKDPSIVCVSGDSAGAMLVLCLLLRHDGRKPALALLISPWVTLVSRSDVRTQSDYLDIAQLRQYGRQLAGDRVDADDPSVSPGCCKDSSWWKRASPVRGIFITYGAEEVLAPEIEDLVNVLNRANVEIETRKERGGIHAWPVASLFLSNRENERLSGLRTMTQKVRDEIPSQ